MRVLLTGSTGFIGRKLGMELVRKGDEVVALVRDIAEAKKKLPFPAELHLWGDEESLHDIDAVVHLAGAPIASHRWSKERKEEILQSRTKSTAQLLEFVRKVEGRRPQAFLSASAVGFYGDRGEELLTEHAPPGAGFLSEVCQAWERESQKANALLPRVVILRFGAVLGRGGGMMEQLLPLYKFGGGGKLGSGDQWMSWIHIDDLVNLLLFTLQDPTMQGVYNAVAPEAVRQKEFARELALVSGGSARLIAPASLLKLILGERSQLLLDSARASSGAIRRQGFRFRYEKLYDALRAICRDVEMARGRLCHDFVSEQWLPTPVDQVFSLFQDSQSLRALSPPEQRLEISTPRVREGTKINYDIPLWFRSFRCSNVVYEWKENQRLISAQDRGAFSLWMHQQTFERLDDGTLIRDRVLYQFRFGILGNLFLFRKIRSYLEKFFAYRRNRLLEFEIRQEQGGKVIPLRASSYGT